MVEPQTITLTISELFAILRDCVFVVGFAVSGWKLRSWVQPLLNFMERANRHMDTVESNLHVILENHLVHLQSSVDKIAEK
jgi:hypothetical protein